MTPPMAGGVIAAAVAHAEHARRTPGGYHGGGVPGVGYPGEVPGMGPRYLVLRTPVPRSPDRGTRVLVFDSDPIYILYTSYLGLLTGGSASVIRPFGLMTSAHVLGLMTSVLNLGHVLVMYWSVRVETKSRRGQISARRDEAGRPRRVRHGLGLLASASPDSISVDRELLVWTRLVSDSTRLIRTTAQYRGLPLVNFLD